MTASLRPMTEEGRRARAAHLLDKLVDAAADLDRDWHPILNTRYPTVAHGYGFSLPSFDEFVHDLMTWRDAVRRHETPPTLTYRNDYGDDIVCSCGNEPHMDGFSSVTVRGAQVVEVEPTLAEWPVPLIQCRTCDAVFLDAERARMAGRVIYGARPDEE
jgi:hypothetical protein